MSGPSGIAEAQNLLGYTGKKRVLGQNPGAGPDAWVKEVVVL